MPKDKNTFENAMSELEKVISSLEKGEAPLDEAMGLYVRGVELVKFCNSKLDDAEKKISKLVENEHGELSVTQLDFDE